jgi:hypothetical protein
LLVFQAILRARKEMGDGMSVNRVKIIASLSVLALLMPVSWLNDLRSPELTEARTLTTLATAPLLNPWASVTTLPSGKTRLTIQLAKELAGKTVLIKHSQNNAAGKRVTVQKRAKVSDAGVIRVSTKRKLKLNSRITVLDGREVVLKAKLRSLLGNAIPDNPAPNTSVPGIGGGGGFGPSPETPDEGFSPKNLVSAVRIGSSVHVVWNQLEVEAPEPQLLAASTQMFSQANQNKEFVVTLRNSQGLAVGGTCRTAAVSFKSQNCVIEIPAGETNLAGLGVEVAVDNGPQPMEKLRNTPAAVILESLENNPIKKLLELPGNRGGGDPRCAVSEGFDAGQVSPDGINFAFRSDSEFLVDGDRNCAGDVFVMNLITGQIKLVSTSSSGSQGNADVYGYPTWSPDGKWLSFSSPATNLIPGVSDGNRHLYIKNVETGELIVADTNLEGQVGNGETCGSDGYWSPDSTRIAFDSVSSNLVPGDSNESCDVFVKNLVSGEIVRVSLDSSGQQINGHNSYIRNSVSFTNRNFWSEDGDSVRFWTTASLLEQDTDNWYNFYGKNFSDGNLTLEPVGFIDDAGGPREWSQLDPSGTRLAYVGDGLKLYIEENGVSTLIADDVFPNDVAWTPDASRIVIAMPTGIGVFYP